MKKSKWQIDILRFFFSMLFCACFSAASAQDRTDDKPFYVPDSLVAHSYGYRGTIGLGLSYEPIDWYDVQLSFGYSPDLVAGRPIKQLNLHHRFHLLEYEEKGQALIGFYAGFGVLYGLDRDLFLILPSQYPDHYYAPTALRYTLVAGIEWQPTEFEGWHGFVEYAWLYSEIIPTLFSPYEDAYRDLGTFGFGLRYRYL